MSDDIDSHAIWKLYDSVLRNDIRYQIPHRDILSGIRNMAKAYSPKPANFYSVVPECPDYNIPGFRYAYLHKYAPLHTYIVRDEMLGILRKKRNFFSELLRSGQFKLCCLGGGPGSDAIGVLAALHTAFNPFKLSVTVVDYMKEWEFTFASVIQKLASGEYGEIWRNFRNFDWNYIGANLLQNMTYEVSTAISSASFITMVKFVSAASCTNTDLMLERIFHIMRPGALVLFIDNAAGGFSQAVERASKKNNFEAVVPTRRHVEFKKEIFKTERFGYPGCCKTTVSILLLKKPNKIIFTNDNFYQNSTKTPSTPAKAPTKKKNKKKNKNSRTTVSNPSKSSTNYNISRNIVSNSDKLPFNDSNISCNSSKSPIKTGNFNENFSTKSNKLLSNDNISNVVSNSHKSSVENGEHSRKTVSSKFPILEGNLNESSRKIASNSYKALIEEGNLYENSRKIDFSATSNQNRWAYSPIPTSPSSITPQPVSNVSLEVESTYNSPDIQHSERIMNQSSTEDSVCCSCCVIS